MSYLKPTEFKKEGSRKGNVPFWVGVFQCYFRDCHCKGELSINTKEDDFMTARLSETILHAVTDQKKKSNKKSKEKFLKNFIRNKSCNNQNLQ